MFLLDYSLSPSLFLSLLVNIAAVQHCNFVLTDFTLEVDDVLVDFFGHIFSSRHFFCAFKTACLFVLSLQFTFVNVGYFLR